MCSRGASLGQRLLVIRSMLGGVGLVARLAWGMMVAFGGVGLMDRLVLGMGSTLGQVGLVVMLLVMRSIFYVQSYNYWTPPLCMYSDPESVPLYK